MVIDPTVIVYLTDHDFDFFVILAKVKVMYIFSLSVKVKVAWCVTMYPGQHARMWREVWHVGGEVEDCYSGDHQHNHTREEGGDLSSGGHDWIYWDTAGR